mgnify:CR=1 FL=1
MINVVFHVIPLILGVGYGAGTLTAIIIFIPLCAWTVSYTHLTLPTIYSV